MIGGHASLVGGAAECILLFFFHIVLQKDFVGLQTVSISSYIILSSFLTFIFVCDHTAVYCCFCICTISLFGLAQHLFLWLTFSILNI